MDSPEQTPFQSDLELSKMLEIDDNVAQPVPAVRHEQPVSPGLMAFRAIIAVGGIYITQTMVTTIAMQSLPALMRKSGMSLQSVGMTSLFLLPWVLKFLWAPVVERWRLPAGSPRRRSARIILVGQGFQVVILLLLIPILTQFDPYHASYLLLIGALIFAALIASTVDIACDGMTVDSVQGRLRGWGNVAQVGGGYIGVVIGGSAFLIIVERYGWTLAILSIAVVIMLLSSPMLSVRESTRPASGAGHVPSLRFAVARREVRQGLMLTVALQAGIRTATGMVGPLLIDRGVSLEQLGWFLGLFSVGAGLFGTLVGGVLTRAVGAWRAVPIVVALQAATLCTLALCAGHAPLLVLTVLVAVKFAAMAAGFVAIYSALMELASPKQAGVDFTLFQCADALIAMIGGMAGGWLAGQWGYGYCFGLAGLCSAGASLIVAMRAPTIEPKSSHQPFSDVQMMREMI